MYIKYNLNIFKKKQRILLICFQHITHSKVTEGFYLSLLKLYALVCYLISFSTEEKIDHKKTILKCTLYSFFVCLGKLLNMYVKLGIKIEII